MRAASPVMKIIAFASCLSVPFSASATADETTLSVAEKRLYMVATAHLDTQWLWTIQDTIRKFLPKTFNNNFDLMKAFPGYVFNFEGSFRYMLIREYYPKAYERIKELTAKGRWRVTGSSVDAGDTNVPSPESLIRHILYGNGYFRDELGAASCDIFLPDCFGFGFVLPTVAVHCGLKGFSTQKLSWGGSAHPFDIGTWEGVDGSSVIAAINPGGYGSIIENDQSRDEHWLKKINELGAISGLYFAMRYYGTGDTGGSPTTGSVKWVERSIKSDGPVKVLSAGADQLFRDITKEQRARLPHYRGELLLTTHGTGCYTAQANLKRWNRKNELLAGAAERAAVAANWIGAAPYPAAFIRNAWIRFLWHQFHDDLTGTSIPGAYQYSWNDEALSLNQFASVLAGSVGAVSRALDTRVAKGSVALVVYNPLGYEREDAVEAVVKFAGAPPPALRVIDTVTSKETPAQIIASRDGELTFLFLAQLPALGFKVFEALPAERPQPPDPALTASVTGLENARYRLKLDADGNVAGIFDKLAEREMLEKPLRIELLSQEKPVEWPAWEIQHEDITRVPMAILSGPARVNVVERGPARATVEVAREVRGSTVTQRISLMGGGAAADRIEFDTRLDWRTPRCVVKAAFPLNVSNTTATYDLGIGTIERGNNTNNLYEVPAQMWADLTAADGAYGVAIMNDSKYGWDKPADNILRLTLVHNPKPKSNDRTKVHQEWQEFGRHHFVYALYGHKGGWREGGVCAQAGRLNEPPIAFQCPPHAGPMGRAFCAFTCSSPDVGLMSIKQAEKSGEVIARVRNLSPGAVKDARLSLAGGIASAREVNGAEESVGPARVEGSELVVDLRPYQPRAYALKLRPPADKLAPPASSPTDLPYDLAVTSADSKPAKDGIDAKGSAIPTELFPAQIEFNGIRFKLGPKDGKNALACKGQTLRIPRGMNRAYILAAGAGRAAAAGAFVVDDNPAELSVQPMTGWIGQADSRFVDGKLIEDGSRLTPGFIQRDPVAWISTHLHDPSGANLFYTFGYLYCYRIDVKNGAGTLKLPDNPAIRVFALTFAKNENDEARPARLLYD
ncbi:MAG: glycoside hydrolase family 38 C-terminal domain-containing protein [bacterium]